MEDNLKIAEYKYVYDPNHTSKPSGNWNRTNSGWSSNVDYSQKSVKPYKPVNPTKSEEKPVEEQEEVDLFDETETDFETDENAGVETEEEPIVLEQEEEETKDVSLDEQEDVSLDEEVDLDDEAVNLDEEQDVSLDEEVDLDEDVNLDEEESFFTDVQKENFLKEENFDSYIEKMNNFITTFDEDEGKENKVTFKAVASNLDWSLEDDAKAFANHCKKQGLDGAEEIIAFLYYQYNENKDKWETILEKMN